MQNARNSISQKDGASLAADPASFATGSGSQSASDVPAKIRALFDVLGPCIVRTCDGGTHVLSAEALKFIPIHEGLDA